MGCAAGSPQCPTEPKMDVGVFIFRPPIRSHVVADS